MNTPIDNSYIGITTPHFREAAEFYLRHFGYSLVKDSEDFISVISPNEKRCLGFSRPTDSNPLTSLKGINLTFLVENAEAALDAFQRSGVKITKNIDEGLWGAKHFVVTDPSGVDLYISERA
jgi:catechol 2,3-dioxygenase-like lactoylglutathione lyase family enzyme